MKSLSLDSIVLSGTSATKTRRDSSVRLGIVLIAAATFLVPGLAFGQSSDLKPSGPLTCGGADRLVVDGLEIVSDDHGVEAGGSCSVTIRNSRIVSGGDAVRASGAARIVIKGSYLEGERYAIRASGTANVTYVETETVGGVKASTTASIRRGSGSSRGSRSSDSSVQIDSSGIQVGDVRIDSSGVSAGGVEVRTGAGGATVSGGGVSVKADGDLVRINVPGVAVDSSWRTANRGTYSAADTDRILVELGAEREGSQVSLDLSGDILFDFNSSAIRGDAATQLSKVAHVIRQRAADQVVLIGHTDSVGDDSYNVKLSLDRATSVMGWLYENEGIPASLMAAKGMGAVKPIAHNTKPDGSDDPQGRAQNRRVEIQFGVN